MGPTPIEGNQIKLRSDFGSVNPGADEQLFLD